MTETRKVTFSLDQVQELKEFLNVEDNKTQMESGQIELYLSTSTPEGESLRRVHWVEAMFFLGLSDMHIIKGSSQYPSKPKK